MQRMRNKLKHSEEGNGDPWAQALGEFYSAACCMFEQQGGVIDDLVHFSDDEVVDIVRDLGIQGVIVRNRMKRAIQETRDQLRSAMGPPLTPIDMHVPAFPSQRAAIPTPPATMSAGSCAVDQFI